MFFQPTLLKEETFNVSSKKICPFPQHWHSDLEILCCIDGSFHVQVRDTLYSVNKDDIILIGSCEPHEIGECSDDAATIMISVGALFCGSTVFKEMIKKRIEMPLLKNNPDAVHEVRRIHYMLSHKKSFADDLETRGRIYLLLTLLWQALPTTLQMTENHQKRLAVTMRVQKALDLVATSYHEPITLDDAADVSGYEKSAFCRMFKNATDSTFHKYLNDYRIKMAMVLMEENHYSIAEISSMVGFSQQKIFSRLFKHSVGMTPSEYRKLQLLDSAESDAAKFEEK